MPKVFVAVLGKSEPMPKAFKDVVDLYKYCLECNLPLPDARPEYVKEKKHETRL